MSVREWFAGAGDDVLTYDQVMAKLPPPLPRDDAAAQAYAAADVDGGAPPRVWAGVGAEACSPCRAPHAEAVDLGSPAPSSAEINQCVRPAWRYYLLLWPPRRSERVLGVLARGVLGLLTRTFDFRQALLGRAAVLDAGSPPGGREVYAFWVNQDVVVPPAAFLGAVRGAAASPLNRRLLAG